MCPPEGLCGVEPERGPIVFTYALLVQETILGVSISEAVIRLFEILKMFYPPEGLCGAEPERGSIVFTLHFISHMERKGRSRLGDMGWSDSFRVKMIFPGVSGSTLFQAFSIKLSRTELNFKTCFPNVFRSHEQQSRSRMKISH